MTFEISAKLHSRSSYGINQHIFIDFNGATLITSAEDLDICVYAVAVKAEKQKLLQISCNPSFEALLYFLW